MKDIMRIDRREQVENAVDKILSQKDFGDTITYEYMEKLFDCEKEDLAFTFLMTAVKELLIEYGFVLRSVVNEGYRILFPNEIAEEVVQKHLKQSTNKLSKALKIMQYTDKSFLKDDELVFFNNIENLIENVFTYNEDSLLSAQAMLNDVKTKELAE